jgi:hypothetical protein
LRANPYIINTGVALGLHPPTARGNRRPNN